MAESKTGTLRSEGVKWTFEDAVGTQKAKAYGEYEDEFDSGIINRMPAPGSAHPIFPGLTLIRRKVDREPGLQAKVQLWYEGWDVKATYGQQEAQPVKRYDMEPTLREEPLLAHKRYASLEADRDALQNILAGNLQDEAGVSYADRIETADGLDALGKIRKGQTHYREPGLIWVERSTVAKADLSEAMELAKIGKIDTPPGGAPTGGNRNYMRIAGPARNSQDGEYYELEKRWELSGEDGWNDLYQTGA